jgi:hypothetical protein
MSTADEGFCFQGVLRPSTSKFPRILTLGVWVATVRMLLACTFVTAPITQG